MPHKHGNVTEISFLSISGRYERITAHRARLPTPQHADPSHPPCMSPPELQSRAHCTSSARSLWQHALTSPACCPAGYGLRRRRQCSSSSATLLDAVYRTVDRYDCVLGCRRNAERVGSSAERSVLPRVLAALGAVQCVCTVRARGRLEGRLRGRSGIGRDAAPDRHIEARVAWFGLMAWVCWSV